tara:strand:- start:50 stop:607 length:558 start_codon:yes stop_codon:yes gene_type:complete
MSKYDRPNKTYTDFLNEVLENQGFNAPSIQEKLKNYIKVINNDELNKDEHIRYFIWDNRENKLKFRTGGFIKIIHDDYLILTNKKNFNWSVQKKIQSNEGIVYRTLFFKKNYKKKNIPSKELINKNEFSIIEDNSDSNSESNSESEYCTDSDTESSYSNETKEQHPTLDTLSKEQLIQLFLNSYQ